LPPKNRPGNQFYIVDVFAEERFGGNQLAVFRNGELIPDKEMQLIARELNYSETTFILSDEPAKNGGYDVRIFTPKEEVPFAGHPTLGTAFVIQQEIIRKKTEKVVLNLKIGQIPVSFSYSGSKPDLLWMRQAQPTFGETGISRDSISKVLGVGPESIDEKLPIEEVSTGLPITIVPLKSLEAIRSIKVNLNAYNEFIKDRTAKGILAFTWEVYDSRNQLNVRVFADYYGVPEDPATGSGNGCLAAYLVKNRYFGKKSIENVRVEQGYEIGRHSLVLLSASENVGSKIDVDVGGRVIKFCGAKTTSIAD
jgi:trans-2,3-dihydro-3-hydroxyanthranilate isomerase